MGWICLLLYVMAVFYVPVLFLPTLVLVVLFILNQPFRRFMIRFVTE